PEMGTGERTETMTSLGLLNPEHYDRCPACRGSVRETRVRGLYSTIPDSICPECLGTGSSRKHSYRVDPVIDPSPLRLVRPPTKAELEVGIEESISQAIMLRESILKWMRVHQVDTVVKEVPLSYLLRESFFLESPGMAETLQPFSHQLLLDTPPGEYSRRES